MDERGGARRARGPVGPGAGRPATPPLSEDLGEAPVLALWLTAWLRGHASADDTRDAVVGGDAAHDVVGLPGDDGTTPLVLALGRFRSAGATAASLALPEPGDPLGLAGPAPFNVEAFEAGQAVVVHPGAAPVADAADPSPRPGAGGWGLVPVRAGAGVVWRCLPAVVPPPTEGVPAAEHVLRRTLTLTADRLVDLEVARWRPEVADELMDLRAPLRLPLPSGLPGRAQALLALATRCRRIVGLALEDDGGAVTAREAAERREALLPLDTAARRAVVAACDPAASR